MIKIICIHIRVNAVIPIRLCHLKSILMIFVPLKNDIKNNKPAIIPAIIAT